ncbi:gamma-butyrobetaine dioxygenase-like [Anopheles marshallii]|uniref:gamma-butyrobetaine dioxygenase-like n=1 Tax=Anopheles marshallii TaxID=1521116 RepID=UPI00237B7311|nr:gamma-butyrobetaine dioxygenase-like [Anopheles marshallii]
MSLLRCVTKLTRAIGASTHFANQSTVSACYNFSNLKRNHSTHHPFGSSGTHRKASSSPLPVDRETSENRLHNSARVKSVAESSPHRNPPSTSQISEATFDVDRSRVVLCVGTERYEFPAVWLRDNCQCVRCFHGGSSSRVLNWERFDVDRVNVAQVSVLDRGQSLQVMWSEDDGGEAHRSVYDLRWLLSRSFKQEDTERYLKEWYRPEPIVWGVNAFGAVLREFSFEQVLRDDTVLRQWIEALIAYGVVMIKDAPLTENECRRLADRVGFIRKTHYGEEFVVKAKEGTSNVAYLSTPLQMHTDLPYYDYKPGCNLLHCLVQSTNLIGGENLIADGFYVAEQLRQHYPDEFRLLSETLVDWSDLGADEAGTFHSIYRAPVICVGRDGRLERINHSVPQRDSHFSVAIERVEPWYRAMQRFVTILHREAVSFKTSPGDILTFSNVRMVHGRTGYTDTAANTRHIVGAYLDWDEIYSKLRVLKATSDQ